jgi:hypothetical protein
VIARDRVIGNLFTTEATEEHEGRREIAALRNTMIGR